MSLVIFEVIEIGETGEPVEILARYSDEDVPNALEHGGPHVHIPQGRYDFAREAAFKHAKEFEADGRKVTVEEVTRERLVRP